MTDFIQEKRCIVGKFEPAKFFSDSAVDSPFSWPNSSLSISPSGRAAQLILINGLYSALALIMDRCDYKLFAGPALPRISTVASDDDTLLSRKRLLFHGGAAPIMWGSGIAFAEVLSEPHIFFS